MNTRTFRIGVAAVAACVGLWASAALGGSAGICYDPGSRDGYVCPPCNCPADRHVSEGPGECANCKMQLVARKDLKYVAIVLYDGVELLDFGGPGEVFAAAGGKFYVYTVSADGKPIASRGFVRVDPEYSIHDCPWPDLLVVPGGGSGALVENRRMMDWIGNVGKQADHVLSVNGNTRFMDSGKVITTAGVSAGIDGALHLVSKLFGVEVARQTAQYMEYGNWEPGSGLVVSTKSR